MFLIMLLLYVFSNCSDIPMNFFHQSIELIQKFETTLPIPIHEPGIKNLALHTEDMKKMFHVFNIRCKARNEDIQCFTLSVKKLLLSIIQDRQELFKENWRYFNAIRTPLQNDWKELQENEKLILSQENLKKYKPYQLLYAQTINATPNKKYLKNLKKFAMYYEIINDFRLLAGALEEDEVDEANYMVCCTIQ